jgi:hypothetical protein
VFVMWQSGFEPTLIKWVLIFRSDAIGSSQGGAYEAEPNLCKQVQNFAAHGMAGIFIILSGLVLYYYLNMSERKDSNIVFENVCQKAKSRFQIIQDRLLTLPSWLIVSIIAIFLLLIFCIVPFLLIDIFNQWCKLLPGFFNAMSPGICP